MIKNYTQEAKRRCFSLIDADIEDIWKDIEQMPTDTDADRWKKKLDQIANEYCFSSRFALMRIFLDRADPSQLVDKDNPACGFIASVSDGSQCVLKNITIEHAEQMGGEEVLQFEKLLLDQASLQSDFDGLSSASIIKKALFSVQKKTTLLTRDEAFQLGHILQFSLEEMEWFLLRVFDVESGFRYNTSNDLIEAYGFLSGISNIAVSKLKDRYAELYGNIQKGDCEVKADDWTKDAGGSLPEMVRSWLIYDRDYQDNFFLQWLGERAPYLDLPSKTALRIYRNLAVYTHNLAIQAEETPDVDKKKLRNGRYETDFVRCVRQEVQKIDYDDTTTSALFDGGVISLQKCKQIADTLLLENLNFTFSDQTDKTKAWHIIQVLTDGRMTVSGGINASRTRVKDILSGRIECIEKSDMLYLLWFLSNLCWFDGMDHLTPEDISNRLNDFVEAAEICLDAAGLPEFYPPHLVEQSMLLSVIFGFGGPNKCDPAEVYEAVCSSVIERRAARRN